MNDRLKIEERLSILAPTSLVRKNKKVFCLPDKVLFILREALFTQAMGREALSTEVICVIFNVPLRKGQLNFITMLDFILAETVPSLLVSADDYL